MSGLIIPGTFNSAAGLGLDFKIDCDTLDDKELEFLALQFPKLTNFCKLGDIFIPVHTGGDRLAKCLQSWSGSPVDNCNTLVVDDVWTTGLSALNTVAENHLMGQLGRTVFVLVIFARGSYPEWVFPIFNLNPRLRPNIPLWWRKP